MRGIGRVSLPGLIFFGVLIVAILVGVVVGGGTGTTIVAIAGALLALTLLGTVGTGVAARDAVDGRGRRLGRPLDDEDPRDRRD